MLWVGCPCESSFFKLPGRANIFIRPIKVPLPTAIQGFIDKVHRWTLLDALQSTKKLLKGPDSPIVKLIDLTIFDRPPLVASCERDGVDYFKLVTRGRELEAAYELVQLVDSIPSPGPTQVLIVACEDGVSTCVPYLAYVLVKTCAYEPEDAIRIVEKARGVSMFAASSNLLLQTLLRVEYPLSEKPDWANKPDKSAIPPSFKMYDLSAKLRQVGSAITGGRERSNILLLLTQLVHRNYNHKKDLIPRDSSIVFGEKRDVRVSAASSFFALSPEGSPGFLIAEERNCFYILFGTNQFFRITAVISTDVPIVCPIIVTEYKSRICAMLTDIIVHKDITFERAPLEARLGYLWHTIMPAIAPFDPKRYVPLIYRPIGKLSDIRKVCDQSLVLLEPNMSPGFSILLPFKPRLTLFVVVNSAKYAVVHALASSGSMNLMPIAVIPFTNQQMYGLDNKSICFDVVKEPPHLIPDCIAGNYGIDTIQRARAVIEFVKTGVTIDKIEASFM